ncbi:hypothetical protein HDZ31DRAFT_34146 [Schizophyllum fasciatum]
MFGESDSESPRVPSPWDSLMSTPASASPSPLSKSPSPITVSAVPKLVPESDDGNIEYKLQLLSPSPARFARLVTQMKWRLLEGGGQAYYELGVADSGALIGLPRAELERSLETLEMMAGEIGASVVIVKEVEVPPTMALLLENDRVHHRRRRRRGANPGSGDESASTLTATETEQETTTEPETETDAEDLAATVVLQRPDADEDDAQGMFSMDPEPDGLDSCLSHAPIDFEISAVYKPRPVRTRASPPVPLRAGKTKRGKKNSSKKFGSELAASPPGQKSPQQENKGNRVQRNPDKALHRKQARDRRREERRRALMVYATGQDASSQEHGSQDVAASGIEIGEETFLPQLEALHVGLDDPLVVAATADSDVPDLQLGNEPVDVAADDDDDDVFPTPRFPSTSHASQVDTDGPVVVTENSESQPRLIVEALVVRKMSLDEAFLDFEGFILT